MNYLKIQFRNFWFRKSISIIKLAGLSVGITCTLLILLWVKYELEYDTFHDNYDEICRVVTEYDGFRTPTTPGPMAAFLQNEIPEIDIATRFKHARSIIKYKEKSIRLDGLNAEPSFMDVFSFPQFIGDVKKGLDDVQSLTLTESASKRLFGDEDPIGKVVQISNKWTGKIAGIVKDVPKNSSPPLQFEYLSPFKIYHFWRNPDSWEASSDYNTWVKLNRNSSIAEVNQKIDALIKKHNPDPKLRIFLQPLKEIHLNANTHRWDGPHGDMQYVIIFSILAVIILTIACINFMNLATARSMTRFKDVGIRKVIGASRSQLIFQFFGESFFFAFLSLPVSWLLLELALPKFNQLTVHEHSIIYSEPWLLISLGIIILFTGFLSGLYPALYLSGFQPIKILKNNFNLQLAGKNFSYRKLLVIGQFSLSIIVIICTLIIFQQLLFIQNENLGFEEENLIYIPLGENYNEDNYKSLKSEISSLANVLSVGGSDQIPTDTDFIPRVKWVLNGEPKVNGYPTFIVDKDFFKTFKMNLVKGRLFSKEFPSDLNSAFVINQSAAIELGFDEPLGNEIEVYNRKGKIIGIVQDFHFETFREEIEPLCIMNSSQCTFLNIRIMPGQITETIRKIEEIASIHYPGLPFEVHFLDQEIDKLYRSDKRMGTLFIYFSILGIFISCLGLFGLTSFIAEQKTKEIGIRKVLGASISSLVQLLSKQFLIWVLIANVIAWPVAWYAMSKWLQEFAYRIDIGWWVYLLSGFIAFFIALITISSQAIRAALANPVESLRYE